jgi:hypothetical protein
VLALLVAAGSAGCLISPGSTVDRSQVKDPLSKGRPTVVALIDSGINPYHDVFRATNGSPDAGDLATAFNGTSVQLSTAGTYAERTAADAKFWNKVKPGTLYAFNGTRILGVTLAKPGDVILDHEGHGTGTSSLVARDDPSALIVMVQVNATACIPPVSCSMDPSVARAMTWAAAQPWIDVISVSIGLPGDLYDPSSIHPEAKAFLDASRQAAKSGKLVIIGSGNTVAPSLDSYLAGPPWVICVGGGEIGARGATAESNIMVDVVANYTEMTALANETSGMRPDAGTSFSTPLVAASLAKAIHLAREAVLQTAGPQDGKLVVGDLPNGTYVEATAADFRSALNATAIVWKPADWNPSYMPTNDTETNVIFYDVTTPVILPAEQIGWGYVNASLAPQIAARVIAHDYSGKDDMTRAYMAQYQSLREDLWQ